MTLNNYKLIDISLLVEGNLSGNSSAQINHLATDSRNTLIGPNSLFIAINGGNRDGHDFINDAYTSGVRNFLVNKNYSCSLKGVNLIAVDNTLLALQLWAKKHRKKYEIPVIAISGSNGKTIVKEWLYHFLRKKFNTVRSPKSYNSQLGVALSLLMINSEHELAIIEAGISQKSEMSILKDMISPTHSIITNIGNAHLENFNSIAELQSEKLLLLKDAKGHVPSAYFQDLACFNNNKTRRLLINNIIPLASSQKIQYTWKDKIHEFSIPFLDFSSAQNATSCVNFLLHFGISPLHISELSQQLPTIALRLEKRSGIQNSLIIDDSYNADIASTELAFECLANEKEHENSIVILSDITQDHSDSAKIYKNIAKWIKEANVNHFIGIGPIISKHSQLFSNATFYSNTEEFLSNITAHNFANSSILVKGARSFKFEQIALALEQKSHDTILAINLKTLYENLTLYKSLIPRKTKLLCMIKAAGYGAGIVEIAKKLSASNVDYLGVAYTDEGIELREKKITTPILVMNAEENSFKALIKNQLTPSIFSLKQLDSFIRTLIDLNISGYPIHLKFDTGMNRLGFYESEIPELISLILSQPEIKVEGLFSHLASSENQDDDDFTLQQFSCFDKIFNAVQKQFSYPIIKHLLNTAGIERFPNQAYDMVRLGLGLYGISKKEGVKPIVSLTTKISQIKKLSKGASIGYGRKNKALKDTTIGIIPIGYADGYSRLFSNGVGKVFINGLSVPTIGNICMDMTIIDLSNTNANEGDQVEIFGSNIDITKMATDINTIPYEILTSISERVKKIYLED